MAQICHMPQVLDMHQWRKYANMMLHTRLLLSMMYVEFLYIDDDDNDDATAQLHILSWPLGQISQ